MGHRDEATRGELSRVKFPSRSQPAHHSKVMSVIDFTGQGPQCFCPLNASGHQGLLGWADRPTECHQVKQCSSVYRPFRGEDVDSRKWTVGTAVATVAVMGAVAVGSIMMRA